MNTSNKHGVKRTLSAKLSQKAIRYKRNKSAEEKESLSESDLNTKKKLKHATNINDNNSALLISNKLLNSFFNQSCISLAKSLLGKVLVRKLQSNEILRGRIVETECYLGTIDKASHSYKGKRTNRNEAMFLPPGTAYVYTIYGMYFCFNISSREEGSAVLIRALEPLQNISVMQTFRSVKRKSSAVLKDKDLCNGPSKLCLAFNIDKQLNKMDLCTSNDLWLEDGTEMPCSNIIACKRIGIDSAGEEWANKPLRFYVKDCVYVSVRNKIAENLLKTDTVQDLNIL